MIVKVGKRYLVRSYSGGRLSKPTIKAEAEKRLREIEYFKHKGK